MSVDRSVAPPPTVSIAPASVASVNDGALKLPAPMATSVPFCCSRSNTVWFRSEIAAWPGWSVNGWLPV